MRRKTVGRNNIVSSRLSRIVRSARALMYSPIKAYYFISPTNLSMYIDTNCVSLSN
jgi:hypothetical protein